MAPMGYSRPALAVLAVLAVLAAGPAAPNTNVHRSDRLVSRHFE